MLLCVFISTPPSPLPPFLPSFSLLFFLTSSFLAFLSKLYVLPYMVSAPFSFCDLMEEEEKAININVLSEVCDVHRNSEMSNINFLAIMESEFTKNKYTWHFHHISFLIKFVECLSAILFIGKLQKACMEIMKLFLDLLRLMMQLASTNYTWIGLFFYLLFLHISLACLVTMARASDLLWCCCFLLVQMVTYFCWGLCLQGQSSENWWGFGNKHALM